jgi:hypothetical protein
LRSPLPSQSKRKRLSEVWHLYRILSTAGTIQSQNMSFFFNITCDSFANPDPGAGACFRPGSGIRIWGRFFPDPG